MFIIAWEIFGLSLVIRYLQLVHLSIELAHTFKVEVCD